MPHIQPVILCGGSGSRLWPLSRELHPKQFIPFGNDTLFGKTLTRVNALPDILPALVVCNEQHRFFASGIVREKGSSATILLEPSPRNTAPAIALAALAAREGGTDPLLLVLPSDHSIDPQELFTQAVGNAAHHSAHSDGPELLLTFGIPPTRPETGYGYIQRGEALPDTSHGVAYTVSRFMEKPDAETARAFVASGGYLWNSGIFLFRASVFLHELARLQPAMHDACIAAWQSRKTDGSFVRFDTELFAAIPANSIDYAVMEGTDKAAMVELKADWSDLGSWGAFYEDSPRDASGNAVSGDVVVQGSENCYLHSSHRLVVALDVKNVAVVETPDAVLVMDREKSQNVKELLARLKQEGRAESASHLRVYRPWGSYEVLARTDGFQVKRIIVTPGGCLSSQYHHHRAEHWVVVRGTATITNGDSSFLLHEDQSTYIPIGAVHRLENTGILPLELIEVQTGSYLGEDDIVRLEDIYGR